MSAELAMKARMKRDGFLDVPLRGRCMEPLLMEGDVARVVPSETPGVGDVCLVRLPGGGFALHRLVAIGVADAAGFVTKGDLSGRAESLGRDMLVGRLVALLPLGGAGMVRFKEDALARRAIVLLSRSISGRSKGSVRSTICRRAIRLLDGRTRKRACRSVLERKRHE